MTISIPVRSKAKKESTVIQWVTRTNALCRGVSASRSEAAVATAEAYHASRGIASVWMRQRRR